MSIENQINNVNVNELKDDSTVVSNKDADIQNQSINFILKLFDFPKHYVMTSYKLISKQSVSTSFKVKVKDVNAAKKELQNYIIFQHIGFILFVLSITIYPISHIVLLAKIKILLIGLLVINWFIIFVKGQKFEKEEEIKYEDNNQILIEYKQSSKWLDLLFFILEPVNDFYITVKLESETHSHQRFLYVKSKTGYHHFLTNIKLLYRKEIIHRS